MTTKLELEVPVDVKGDADLDKLNRQLDETADKTEEVGSKGSRGFDLLKGAAIGFGIGLATLGVDAVLDGIGNSIELASDKAESASKVNVIYGDSADIITRASEGAAQAVGLSSGKYLESAGNLGNLLQAMDVTGPAAADMSVDMIQLAADVGSFNNADPTEVVEAMGAAFRGESEPLRRFGVLLDEASVKAKAVELGLYSGKGALEASARAQAVYALILEDTAVAQGDFARTSEGLANQQRINAARMEDAWTRVGEKLAPIAAELMPLLADALIWVIDGIAGVVDVIADWIDDNRALIDGLSNLADAIIDSVVWALDLLMKIVSEVGYRLGGLVNLILDVLGAIIDFGSAVVKVLSGDFEGAALAAESGLNRIGSFAENVQRVMGDTGRRAADEAEWAAAAAAEAAERAGLNVVDRSQTAMNAMAAIAARGGEDIAQGATEGVESGLENGLPAVDRAAGELGATIPDNLEEGAREAARIAAETPGELAARLRSGRDDWRSALDLLKDDMQSAMDRTKEIAKLEAVLSGKAIQQGLASTDPIVRAQAQHTVDLIEARLEQLRGVGTAGGDSLGDGIAAGLEKSSRAVVDHLNFIANKAQRILELGSPAKEGPWSKRGGPAKWLERAGGMMADGLERGWDRGIAGGAFLGGAPVQLSPAMAGGRGPGGGDVYHITIQTGVGDPVAIGRGVVESIQAFERSNGRDWRSE